MNRKYKESWEKADGKCIFCGKPIPPYSIHHQTRDRKNDTFLVPACWKCHTAIHNGSMPVKKAMLILNNFFPNDIFCVDNGKIICLTK